MTESPDETSPDSSTYASLKAARNLISAEGGKVAPLSLSEEELNPPLPDDLELQVAPLESMDSSYQVPYDYPKDSGSTEFGYFEDGKQRTVQIGYIPCTYGNHEIIIPVHYFSVAAVILQREDRRLRIWKQPIIRNGILVQRSLLPNQALLEEYEANGLLVVGTRGDSNDYYNLRRQALQEAKSQRLSVENELIGRWVESSVPTGSFLVVDGTLMNLRNEDSVERCVGVSKSFGSRYFSTSDHNRILQMKEFHRSWAFKFHGEEDDTRLGGRERVSWYLRLRSKELADPEFGLVRVEISQRHVAEASQLADQLSRSLISERLPTSYPRPRWDKHLYPICECENYLASVMPAMSTIQASMSGGPTL